MRGDNDPTPEEALAAAVSRFENILADKASAAAEIKVLGGALCWVLKPNARWGVQVHRDREAPIFLTDQPGNSQDCRWAAPHLPKLAEAVLKERTLVLQARQTATAVLEDFNRKLSKFNPDEDTRL